MYAQVENPKENKKRTFFPSVLQRKNNVKKGFGFVNKRCERLIQKRNENDSKKSVLQKLEYQGQYHNLNCAINSTEIVVIQRKDSDDEDWEPEQINAPQGYMKPSDYYAQGNGNDHSDLDGKVAVKTVDNYTALWWLNPSSTYTLTMTGSRSGDVAVAGGNDAGLTWHHCRDYAGGKCTFQQVKTTEHSSWGHYGGVEQYVAAKGKAYAA